MAIIIGTNGNDVGVRMLAGSNGADQILGLAGDDLIFGNDGNDTIFTGSGFDTVRAGSGNDTIRLESARGDLDGESGTDTLVLSWAGAGTTTFDLAAGTGSLDFGSRFWVRGFENITTGAARDLVFGTEGDNFVDTGAGADTIFGRGGDDVISAGDGDDSVQGGMGDDLMLAGRGSDRFDGGADFDTVSYAASATSITVDLLAWRVTSEGETDAVASIERFVGTAGVDRFIGGAAAVDFAGGDGGDSFVSGAGATGIAGGAGDDWADYRASGQGVAINLATGLAFGGHATGDRLSGIENLTGSNSGDQLTGDGSANSLHGLAGADVLSGGAGRDVLIGYEGRDELTGGADADIFYFSDLDAGASDVIHDFQRGVDKIYLAMDANEQTIAGNDFTRLTHYADPEANAGFTAGTINVRLEGAKTIIELDTDDALVGGRDVADYSIELSGRVDLMLSDFIL